MNKIASIKVYKKFISDISFASAAHIAGALKDLAILMVLSKMLGPQGYGVWVQIIAAITLLVPIALLQLDWAMKRSLAAETDKTKINKGFFSILAATSVTSVLFSFLLFIFAEPFATTFLKGTEATSFIRLSSALILLTTLNQVLVEYFIAFRQFRRYATFFIAKVMCELSLIVYLTSSDLGLYGAITALVIIRSLFFLIGFYFVKRQISFTLPSFATLKPYLLYSLPLLPFTLCFWLMDIGDRLIIGYYLNAVHVGLYSAAYGFGAIINLFYSPLIVILFPTITYLFENKMINEVNKVCQYAIKLFMSLAIPSAFGLLFLSKPLLNILTTREFAEAHFIVPVIAFGHIVFCSSYVFSDILLLFKKTKLVSLVFLGSALFNLGLNIVLVPQLGIIGASISTLFTFIIHFIILGIFSSKLISFGFDLKFLIKCLASSSVMSIMLWKFHPTNLVSIIISASLGTIIYFFFLFLLKGIKQEETAFLKNIVKRFSRFERTKI
ncbi:polysaccharide biosynthesis C-terminal domain-containing protein [Acidobacteriota bacterium]